MFGLVKHSMDQIEQSSDNRLYQIRVRGILDEKWAEWFDGFAISWKGQEETVLTGRVIDQAALHGILAKVRNLGLDLLLVKRIEGKDE